MHLRTMYSTHFARTISCTDSFPYTFIMCNPSCDTTKLHKQNPCIIIKWSDSIFWAWTKSYNFVEKWKDLMSNGSKQTVSISPCLYYTPILRFFEQLSKVLLLINIMCVCVCVCVRKLNNFLAHFINFRCTLRVNLSLFILHYNRSCNLIGILMYK